MEEVERIAERVAIIDHGKILIIGTIEEILKKAGKEKLEDARKTLRQRRVDFKLKMPF